MKDIKCIYCNKVCKKDEVTIEHIIPTSLYDQFRENAHFPETFYLTAPACFECNNQKSKYDEEFRNLIVLSTAHFNSFSTQLLETVARSIKRNNRYRNEINDDSFEEIKTPSGESLLKLNKISFDVINYIKQITKAIYINEFEEYFDNDKKQLRVHQFDPIKKQKLDIKEEWLKNKKFTKRKFEDDPVFQYLYWKEGKDLVFVLSFFQYENFMVLIRDI